MVCQIPGCRFPAEHPVGIGHLCTPCRRRVRSRAFLSPLLYWGMLWVMAHDLKDLLLERSEQLGRFTLEHRRYGSVKDLRQRLCCSRPLEGSETHTPSGLDEFLSWAFLEGIGLPTTELQWLERFATKINEKGQRRILSTYWRMLVPVSVSKKGWIILEDEGTAFEATANVGPAAVEKVIRAMKIHVQGKRTTWVLTTPWDELFPEVKQIG